MYRIAKGSLWGSMLIITAVAAVLMFNIGLRDVQAASVPKDRPVTIRLLVTGMPPSEVIRKIKSIDNGKFRIDSFFDITYEIRTADNIGSSGMDGVRTSSFRVDSFFDITYEIADADKSAVGSWETEIVSMSLTGSFNNLETAEYALQELRNVLLYSKSGSTHREFYGHVTVLK